MPLRQKATVSHAATALTRTTLVDLQSRKARELGKPSH